MDKVLQTDFHTRINKGLRLTAKAKAIELLAGMLEGRSDTKVHTAITAVLEPKVFEMFHLYLAR